MASQSQGQSQDCTIEDPRLAELLKPIKDLTQNWELPLTEILSGYLDELQQVTITFDGGQTSVNFAQAALYLQGTASVYSKKVDFLWQMVLKTTELLRNKDDDSSQGEDGAPEEGRKGRKKQVDMTREFELLVTELGKNIDLKLDEEETITERKNALNFIYVTPRQLIEKEGSEQKAVKVNLYMGVGQSKWDLLAAKEDFRINGQYVVQTGYLGEELNVDNQYLNLVNEDTVGDHTDTLQADADNNGGEVVDEPMVADDDAPDPAPDLDNDDPGVVDADMSVMSERAVGQQHLSTAERDMISSPPPPLVAKNVDITPEPVFDPWEPLDPHKVMETPKPIKVKKTVRLPPSLKSKKEPNSRPITPISEYLNKEMSIDLHKPGLFPYLPSSLSDLAYDEYERRKERERQERKARLSKRSETQRNLFPNIPEDDGNDEDRFGAEDNYDDHGGDNDDDPVDNDEPNDMIDDLQLPNPHIGGDLGALVVGDIDVPGDAGDGEDNQTLSYEELVARKVEEFVTQSREYMRSSELAMKVANWHEMIGPRLEQVEKRNVFDIHAYGSRILNNFSEDRSDVSFNSVVRGQKPEEKSR